MNLDEFAQQLRLMREQIGKINQTSSLQSAGNIDLITDALEELQVAYEELRQQQEELLNANAHIETAQQRYQDLFEFAPDGYIVTDSNGMILEANSAASNLLNTPSLFLLNTPVTVYIDVEQRRYLRKEMLYLRPEKGARDLEVRLLPRKASPIDAWLRVAAHLNSHTKQLTFRWLIRDITDRKQAQEEISLLYDEAQRAIEFREEQLSVTAHELRTPLTSLQGFAQLLLRQVHKSDRLDTGFVERVATNVTRQSTKLSQLINQLLDTSRIEAGYLTPDKQPTDIHELVHQTIDIVQDIANVNGNELQLKLPEQPITALLDPLRIEQVLVNLLDNAIRYSPRGQAIEVDVFVTPDQIVRIAVRDHGAGVPLEHRASIFKRFYRINTKEYLGGMGLGLYISKQIVELHNGRLEAEFPSDGGSIFSIYLPISA